MSVWGADVGPHGDTARERVLEVAAAGGDITVVASDLDLRAFLYAAAVGSDAEIHRGFAAAVADGLQFSQVVRDTEQRRAAGEELALEIRPEPVAKHRNVEGVGDVAYLPDLLRGEKLRLVD